MYQWNHSLAFGHLGWDCCFFIFHFSLLPSCFVCLGTKIHVCGYRTKEQLSYVVECSPRVTYRISGFCFCVQSSEYHPVHLQGRIENLLNGLEELLVSVPDSFNLHVLSVFASLWTAIKLTWLGFLILKSYNPPCYFWERRKWMQIVKMRGICN